MTNEIEKKAFSWAVANQGFRGTFADWQALSTEERREYEIGAAGGVDKLMVAGLAIQYDKSGVGHCWVSANDTNCPDSIQEEIAAEIIDGGNDDCDDFIASNGCHYRW